MIRPKRSLVHRGAVLAVVLAAAIAGGSAASIKYSYDARAAFPAVKTYRWGFSQGGARPDHILEVNVQHYADLSLGSKGLTRKDDQADVVVWMSYGDEYGKDFEIRVLTLNIARADNGEPLWRGTASGRIRTDAGSKELEDVVKGILSSFPPK